MNYDPVSNEFVGGRDGQGLPQVMWHITDRCPLRCPYCFATKTAVEVPRADILPTIEALLRLDVSKVDIGGGEPLVASCLPEVVDALERSGLAVTLTTSGAGSSEARQWLVENAYKFARVILSVDGGEEEHDELRGRVGTYATLVELAAELRRVKYEALRVNTVVTSRFVEPGFAERCRSAVEALHPAEWCLIQPHPANEKPDFEDYATSDEFFARVIEHVMALGADSPLRILSRTAANYSGYWVLYPDGQLRPHTDGAADGDGFAVLDASPTEILEAVSASPPWLPGADPAPLPSPPGDGDTLREPRSRSVRIRRTSGGGGTSGA